MPYGTPPAPKSFVSATGERLVAAEAETVVATSAEAADDEAVMGRERRPSTGANASRGRAMVGREDRALAFGEGLDWE